MARTCGCTVVLILLALVYPIGAPIALGISHGWFNCLWWTPAMPSSSLSVSGLAVLTGLVLFPCTFANVWKMGVGYIAAVLLAIYVIFQDYSSGRPTASFNELSKPIPPAGRRQRRRAVLDDESSVLSAQGKQRRRISTDESATSGQESMDDELEARRLEAARRTRRETLR